MNTSTWKGKKTLVLGITGAIAAYKTADIIREFVKREWKVNVMMTEGAERFVAPLTFSVISGNEVFLEKDFLSDERGWKIPHISLSDIADVIVIAPCSASTLHKLAHGDGSTLVSATVLASKCPVVIFPSMNSNMWENKATQRNVQLCRDLGYIVVEPEKGKLACGYEGKGRLPSLNIVVDEILRAVCPVKDLLGKKVLVTAGPTYEYIDPVRYIGNPSSGKMGFAIAKEAWYRGADVTVVSGPVSEPYPYGVNVVPIISAEEMYEVVMNNAKNVDIIVKAAAVGDYRVKEKQHQKMKREGKDKLTIELISNKDIAAELGKRKKSGQLIIGFAAETNEPVENAKKKLQNKNLDMIVINDVTAPNAGFRSDSNTVTLLSKEGVLSEISGSKDIVAEKIWDVIRDKFLSVK